MKMFKSLNVVVKKAILVLVVLSLIQPSAFSTAPLETMNSQATLDLLTRDLLAAGVRSEVRKVNFGFEKTEKFYTNSIAVFKINELLKNPLEQIPDQVVKAIEKSLTQQVEAKHLKGFKVQDIAGTHIVIHVSHNFGEQNASITRIMLEALRSGLTEIDHLLAQPIRNLSLEQLLTNTNPIFNEDSKVERGAESVVVAVGVGVGIGAANIKLFHEFAIPGSTPLQKLGLEKSPGFRFRVKRTADIIAGKFDSPESEFEISVDQRDSNGNIVRVGKNESIQLLAFASQPNDYQITAIYPVENISKGTVPSHEPAVTVIYQPVYGTNGQAVMNPVIIYRSQSGFDAVGGIANMVYDVNFVPGGENGNHYVATTPVTLEQARKAPAKGLGYFATYAYQSRENGEIPVEGIRDHVAFNPEAYGSHQRLAARLAAVMSDHEDDQPFLSPGASESLVESIREEQDHLFIHSPKESEEDTFLNEVNQKVSNGTFVNVTDDKADMGGRVGHTNVPEMMIAIYRASLMEAIEQGIISDGNTIGFAGEHLRVPDVENVGVGDDGHLLMLGDKTINGAAAHQLSFLAFTRTYLFSIVTGKKYYGTGQDFQGPEAKAAIKNPFFYSKLTPRFFELLEQMIPQNEIKLGVIEKVEAKWQEWEHGDKSVELTAPFSGNVSQQGIGSARYSFNPKEEKTFDVIAGDKMGPAALNRLIKHMVFNAIAKGEFQNGLVFEIWDLKAFDHKGNILTKDIPVLFADVKTLGFKTEADKDLVYQAYENGQLKSSLSEADQQKLATILKKSGYVPSKRIFLDAVQDKEAIIRYLADSDRFNVKHVWSKKSEKWDINNPLVHLDRPLLGASVTRLGILTGGEYVGKDDPVIVGNTALLKYGHEFLRTRPLIVQGDMNGSHWEQAVPTGLKYAVATVRSHPILVSLRYTVSKDGKRLVRVADISGRKSFNKTRQRAHEFNREFDKAQLGQFEPHGTNARTVEGSYELAKILRKLNQSDSPFLLNNKKEEAKKLNLVRVFPDATANHLDELFKAAVSDQARAEVRNAPIDRTEITKRVKEAIASISGLTVSEIDETKTFSELGIDSVRALDIELAIEDHVGQFVDIVFRKPELTVGEIITIAEQELADKLTRSEVREQVSLEIGKTQEFQGVDYRLKSIQSGTAEINVTIPAARYRSPETGGTTLESATVTVRPGAFIRSPNDRHKEPIAEVVSVGQNEVVLQEARAEVRTVVDRDGVKSAVETLANRMVSLEYFNPKGVYALNEEIPTKIGVYYVYGNHEKLSLLANYDVNFAEGKIIAGTLNKKLLPKDVQYFRIERSRAVIEIYSATEEEFRSSRAEVRAQIWDPKTGKYIDGLADNGHGVIDTRTGKYLDHVVRQTDSQGRVSYHDRRTGKSIKGEDEFRRSETRFALPEMNLKGIVLPTLEESKRISSLRGTALRIADAVVLEKSFILQGGLAFVGSIFRGPVVVLITGNPETDKNSAAAWAQVEAFKKQFPQSGIEIAETPGIAKEKLIRKISDLGGVRESFQKRAVVTPGTSYEVHAALLKEFGNNGVFSIGPIQFNQMAQSAGVVEVVNQLVAAIRTIAKSA